MATRCCNLNKSGAGKRIFWILVVGLIVAAVVSTSTGRQARRSPSAPPQPVAMAGMSAKKLQTHASENAVLAGAAAGQREVASNRKVDEVVEVNALEPQQVVAITVPPPAREHPGKPKAAVRITRIRSEAPHASKEKALDDALLVARIKLAEKLHSYDPAITSVPTLDKVRNDYLRPDSVSEIKPKLEDQQAWAAANLETNRVWVEVDVEVTDEQVRELRSEGRLGKVGFLGAGAFVLILGLFGFLRLDAWTKGYLTTAIGATIAAAVIGAIAMLLLA